MFLTGSTKTIGFVPACSQHFYPDTQYNNNIHNAISFRQKKIAAGGGVDNTHTRARAHVYVMRTIEHNRTGVDSEWWVEFPRRRVRFNWKIIKASGSHAIMFFCFMLFRILSLYYSNGAFTTKRIFKTFLINFTSYLFI